MLMGLILREREHIDDTGEGERIAGVMSCSGQERIRPSAEVEG